MKKLMFVLAAVVGFCATTLLAETPPDRPSEGTGGGGIGGGGGTPPDKPGEGGTGGGGEKPGGSSDSSVALTGAWQYISETNTLANTTLESTTTNQNVVLAMTNAYVVVTKCVLNKSGDTSSEDNSNFYALNAVVAAKTASTICINNSELYSNAKGANCMFASGDGSTIYAYDCTINSTMDSSRGLDATYEGTVIGSKLTINTEGDHCAAFATDRGNGSISVTDATMETAGQGSPLIYSTGVIEVNCVTGTATGAQIAGIEGLSTIRIKNSNLTGSGKKASEPVVNGVIIYQSNSGDSMEGTATFEVSESTLTSAITNGAMFYITHSAANIKVQDTALDFDTTNNYLLNAAGNDGLNGWGNAGSNGAEVVFTAINQTLVGNIAVDGISAVDLYLTNSTYTGTFVADATNAGKGNVNVFVSADSKWIVTGDCTLNGLTVANGERIVDSSGKTVSIVKGSEKMVEGTSTLQITVSDYSSGNVVITNEITKFEISRTEFEAMYGTSQSEGGSEEGEVIGGGEEGGNGSGSGSGGVQDHNNWTNYFKPYPPKYAIVKIRVEGATDYGVPDRDHKYCLDGYWDGNSATGVVVHLLYVTQEHYLFAGGCTSNTWDVTITNNAQEVDPPTDVVAIKAQAKSGATYYLTLQEAIDKVQGKHGAKISLDDNVTLEKTLVATNSVTIDLCSTNVITLSSELTNAFYFTSSATISNGTINSSLAANVEGSVLMCFADSKKVTLKDLTINGNGYETVVAHVSTKDSKTKYSIVTSDAVTCDDLTITGNGRLLAIDYAKAVLTNSCSFTTTSDSAIYCTGNGTVTIVDGTYSAPKVLESGDIGGKIIANGGTFSGQIYSSMSSNTNNYNAEFTFNGGTYTNASIAFAYADSFDYSSYTKCEDVEISAPMGYAWKDNALVRESLTAGEASESYSDAQAATNAAATINENKANKIAVPTGVEEDSKTDYLAIVEATITSDNRVVVDLTPAAQSNEQAVVDAAVTNETAVAALISTNQSAKVTIEKTTPGLYYWIDGGTDVNAVSEAGDSKLSTNGGSVELSKPKLDSTKGKAFFRISSGMSKPE